MKTLYILFIGLLVSGGVMAQSCLPEGIQFDTQSQIDSFQINYPGCIDIEGDLKIYWPYPDDISNLDGLNVVQTVGGDLIIIGADSLTSLSGLDNLTFIGGSVRIDGSNLSNLAGLDNVTTIEGGLVIGGGHRNATPMSYLECYGNPFLTNLSGLGSLTSIGGSLVLYCNEVLSDLSGLINLTSIGGGLYIGYAEDNDTNYSIGNQSLTNLSGLDNVSSIGGAINIQGNFSLQSLAGIENIEATSIENLEISYNDSLFTCEVQSVCDYLAAPNGVVSIHKNAAGCNNPSEVTNACGSSMACLPYGNYYFHSQSDIDDFPTNYPDCTVLEGWVFISGEDITNLNGLSEVTSFGWSLIIAGNDTLSNLTGLNSVANIAGNLNIGSTLLGYWIFPGNMNLTNLSGLNNLTSVNGNLEISENDYLTDISDLDNLVSINSDLIIKSNNNLLDLSSMENLSFIGRDLNIWGNGNLLNIEGLENLQTIGRDLYISSNNGLISISGLENISSIEGDLSILDNAALTSLAGLDNVTSIGGDLWIGNSVALTSLTGLDNVTSIGGRFGIGNTVALTSLTGLDNVTSIGGDLWIENNATLASLSGLDNIEAFSIEDLVILNNPYLSHCSVLSICNYLSNPNGTIEIYNNTTGCDSPEEVQDSCYWVSVDEPYIDFTNSIFLHPNPASHLLTISSDNQNIDKINIFNLAGQKVLEQRPSNNVVDVSGLKSGMYIVELELENQKFRKKLIVRK